MKKLFLPIFLFLACATAESQVIYINDTPTDTVYVVDSVDYLPDSLDLYEEQRKADFEEAQEVFGDSDPFLSKR